MCIYVYIVQIENFYVNCKNIAKVLDKCGPFNLALIVKSQETRSIIQIKILIRLCWNNLNDLPHIVMHGPSSISCCLP